MTSHDEIIERMDRANPLPDVDMITDGQLAEMMLQVEQTRHDAEDQFISDLVPARASSRWWIKPALAFAVACALALGVIGVVSLATGGESNLADRPAPPTSAPMTAVPVVPEWNQALATTRARPIPAAATCPAGTDPDAPGPVAQARPAGSGSLLSGVFDHQSGQVILVDEQHATWGFDLCTNTWSALEPRGAVTGNIESGLVYDVDSDLTVVLEEDEVFVYDATTNTWAHHRNDTILSWSPQGAIYDPVSGLILAAVYDNSTPDAARMEAWAYDVDSDTWTLLGHLATEGVDAGWQYDLVGYSEQIDRLILTPTGVDPGNHTLLVDPRSGNRTIVETPTPVITFGWPEAQFAPAGESAYVAGIDWVEGVSDNVFHDAICGLDIDRLTWTQCLLGPERTGYETYNWFDAMVGDSMNNRLILINGVYGTFGSHRTDHVWAIDLDTGDLIELLAPSD